MSQTTPIIYEAEIYRSEVSYRNFSGEVKNVDLQFSLHPLKLMGLVAGFQPKKIKSGNPSRNGQTEITEQQQIQFVHDIAKAAAGTPTDDGEGWDVFENFENELVGQAFLTKLSASDQMRRDFAETVLLKPFRAFVGFASADESNSQKDVENFKKMLAEMEQTFAVPEAQPESLAERKARVAAEMAAIEAAQQQEGTE